MQASPALDRSRPPRAPRQRAFNQCPSSQQRVATRTRRALRAAMPKRRAEADEDGGEDAAGGAEAPAAPPGEQSTGKKGKFRKEKPWDVDGTDHWCASRCQTHCQCPASLTSCWLLGKSSRFARRTTPGACLRRAHSPRCSPSTEARAQSFFLRDAALEPPPLSPPCAHATHPARRGVPARGVAGSHLRAQGTRRGLRAQPGARRTHAFQRAQPPLLRAHARPARRLRAP